jgi:hypothetical protein
MEEYPVQQYVEKMRQDQIERYHQEALKHGTEEQWQKNLAKTQEETGIERIEKITKALNWNLPFFQPDINLLFARMAEYTRRGGDPTYFTSGAGAGGGCNLL